MINIAVCDDQAIHKDRLTRMIREICAEQVPEKLDCRIYNKFSRAADITDFLKTNSIDILFLDIEMDGMNGFELASVLNKESPDTIIIFVSSYENYVYSAFEYAPFRFLRKTHLKEELMPALLSALQKLTAQVKTIELNTSEGPVSVRLSDILYFESSKNYVTAHLAGSRTYRFRSTLGAIAEQRAEDDFFRIQNSYVINLAHIKRIAGAASVVMDNGAAIPVSSNAAREFRMAYLDFTRRCFTK